MAQQQGNPAQSLLDLRAKIGDYTRKAENFLGGDDSSGGGSSKPDTSWHDSMVKTANKSFADAASKSAKQPPAPQGAHAAHPNSFKHGGVVQKTGVALVHKGETVIPANEKESAHLSRHRVVMHLNNGGLHRATNTPEGEGIPEDKIKAAKGSKNPHVSEMANLAHGMAGK